MQSKIKIVLATEKHLNSIDDMYQDCIKDLNEKGLAQWDDIYPNREYFLKWIKNKEFYLLLIEEKIIGAVALNEKQAPEWVSIKWKNIKGKCLAIHALAIHPDFQKKVYGKIIYNFCENFAIKNRYNSIRLDAFSENKTALEFYKRKGFEKMGEVYFSFKPKGLQCYFCFEKILNK
ncbi:MAG: GNAT family N-acetyltransferase [Candidatus Helarchaeota archaeon]|nr:GNAT family N-acetyltransferase [Candidatus Helarchaeota archaeon]